MSIDTKSPWSEFTGLNAAYLAELYDRYRTDPGAVDPGTRAFFDRWGGPPDALKPVAAGLGVAVPSMDCDRVSAARALSTAIRMYGHHAARLSPLGGLPLGDTELLPESHGLRESDLAALPASVVGGPLAASAANALEAIEALMRLYQGTIGYEFERISNAAERSWLFDAVESGWFRPPRVPIDGRWLLERLTYVEAFERFLQTAFPTQTRFSIEGLDVMIPMLDVLIEAAASGGSRAVMLGMAHRGRLNVLAHVLGKPYEQIMAEFRGGYQRPNVSVSGSSDLGWTGDVKYHLGAGVAINGSTRAATTVTMVPNPSHLEYVNPVVEGMARAAGERRDRPGAASLEEGSTLAVLIHGDAAFPGEGIVAETLNLSGLPGYRVGGTVHLIANNQLGFTTPPELGRSTLFASDPAKGFEIPIVHVNADDPEACLEAVRLAHAYHERFRKDVVIDLIGYRRLGHNEGDEPSFTQPVMYRAITEHPTVRELWAREMAQRGVVTSEEAAAMLQAATERLAAARRAIQKVGVPVPTEETHPAGLEAGGTVGGLGHAGAAAEVETALPAETLRDLNNQLLDLPPGFHLHPKLEPLYARRRSVFAAGEEKGERRVDWSHAEALAFASILKEGTPIRLTGQDTSRGTFGQRHMLLHDMDTGDGYISLQHIPAARAAFDVWDSPLSEAAVLGFEFGYNVQAPDALVLWEAQYGDFVNAAQVIIDAFITSARSKWGELPSLVLLLPHGYEGQGPEHSSARVERFLQLAAEDNVWIANCTTAAQYFHLLRRHHKLLRVQPRPLVLLTPKSLLRHPMAASSLEEFTSGRFQAVIDDAVARLKPETIRRLILCSGKVFVDLEAGRSDRMGASDFVPSAIVRVEELYPFPADSIGKVIQGYPNLEEVAWVQEEPRNMGAWLYMAPRLRDLLGGRLPLLYGGRTRRASPAEGSYEWHVAEQRRIVDSAFKPFGER